MWKQLKNMAQEADLPELVQTALVSAIFAFMLAKLISLIISIRSSINGGNIRLERSHTGEDTHQIPESCSSSEDEQDSIHGSSDGADVSGLSEGRADVSEVSEPENPPPLVKVSEDEDEKMADLNKPPEDQFGNQSFIDLKYDAGYEQSGSSCAEVERRVPSAATGFSEVKSIDEEDDSDWEGVESTELDETFGAASSYVATQAGGLKVSTDLQLQLYGLYKVATEGPCGTPQPSAIKMAARAKWNAWQKLGDISAEDAMERYIKIVCEICPEWMDTCSKKGKPGEESSGKPGGSNKGAMGPVFSTLILDDGSEGGLEALHDAAREGNETTVIELLDQRVPVDVRDSHGGTALHWATDRGHLNIVELLLARGADVQAKDKEGQTALHLAAVNEREIIAKLLFKNGADTRIKDVDGITASSLAPSGWDWMKREA